MIELDTSDAMRAWSRAARGGGTRVAFVPTMGSLHEGHLRLLDRARALADQVVVSIFVNPTQFGPSEDFASYPRDLARDRAAAMARGADVLFTPATKTIYPADPLIGIDPGPLANHLCGPHRPGHFAGVLLVVTKLLHIVEPDVAVFGRKDAQQAMLVRRLVEDLDFAVTIAVEPTVREADGLALSSRNVNLIAAERSGALALPRALEAGHAAWIAGERRPASILAAARQVLGASPQVAAEYVELVDPRLGAPVVQAHGADLLAVAARVGPTRLIDNVILGAGLAGDQRLDD